MSFSELDIIRRTRKGNFLKQIDQLIDWDAVERAISVHMHRLRCCGAASLFGIAVCLRCYWSGFGTVV